MSIEIMVTIALAAVGGLSFLLWNTDGSLDWLGYAAGAALSFIWLQFMVWNAACSILSYVGYAAAGGNGKAVQDAIQARAWDGTLMIGIILSSLVCSTLPHIIRAARIARR